MPKNKDEGRFSWIVTGMLLSALVMTREAPAADPQPALVAPAPRAALQPGQVWQCTINGQRVFSDSRCGDDATIRQLRETNIMPSSFTPAPPYPPSDEAPYPPAPVDEAAPEDATDSGIGQDVFLIHERSRRAHSPKHPSVHPRSHKN